jgi:hypothetical protein
VKFVRWLGAFGRGESLTVAAAWEVSQVARQVAAEPLDGPLNMYEDL